MKNNIEITVARNEEKKGLEIYFQAKPDPQVLSALKVNKFRWHGLKKCWYAKETEATLAVIEGLKGGEIVAIAPTTKEVKEVKEVQNVHGHKVGDLFYTSWGYEQTNIDFYVVVSVTAKSMMLQEIGSKPTRSTGSMSGYVVPDLDNKQGEPFKVMSPKGNYKAGNYYLHKTTATEEHHETSYY